MADSTQMIRSTQIPRGKEFVVESEIPVAEFNAYFEEMGLSCHSPEPLKYHAVLVNKGAYISLEADMAGDLSRQTFTINESYW